MIDIPSDPFEAARFFINILPHGRELGLDLVEVGEGFALLSLPWNEKLIGDPYRRVIHGGAVSTLIDTAAGTAVLLHSGAPSSTATLDLRIDYMRSARPDHKIFAHATCHHMANSVAFVKVVAYDTNIDEPIALGTGAFTVDRSQKPLIGKMK